MPLQLLWDPIIVLLLLWYKRFNLPLLLSCLRSFFTQFGLLLPYLRMVLSPNPLKCLIVSLFFGGLPLMSLSKSWLVNLRDPRSPSIEYRVGSIALESRRNDFVSLWATTYPPLPIIKDKMWRDVVMGSTHLHPFFCPLYPVKMDRIAFFSNLVPDQLRLNPPKCAFGVTSGKL